MTRDLARVIPMLLVLALGCTATPPTETASPTTTVQPTPSAGQPTYSPATTATTRPVPTATPTATTPSALDRLMANVPSTLSCGRLVSGFSGPPRISCSSAAGVVATYTLYPDAAELRRAYADVFSRAQIDADSGNCARPETWPAEGHYSQPNDTDGGRFLCLVRTAGPMIYWTIDSGPILAVASRSDNDQDRLWHFWLYESSP